MMSKALPVIFPDAFIQPLKVKAKVMRKASKIVFNVWDPSLWAGIWVDTDEFFRELSTLCIDHQPSFLSSRLIVVFISSPLPFPLLTLFSRLFSPICMGGRMRQVLRRTSLSFSSSSFLVSSSGRAHNNNRRMRNDCGLSCYSPRLFIPSRAHSSRRPRL